MLEKLSLEVLEGQLGREILRHLIVFFFFVWCGQVFIFVAGEFERLGGLQMNITVQTILGWSQILLK